MHCVAYSWTKTFDLSKFLYKFLGAVFKIIGYEASAPPTFLLACNNWISFVNGVVV